jgi:heptosyltransferase-1
MKTSQRILIVKPSALGDIIHALPVAIGIKKINPNAIVGWVVSRPYQEILENNPYIDKLFIFERKRWGGMNNFWQHKGEFFELIHNIRAARFGTVLDLQGLLRSGIITLLSGAPRRIGFKNAREIAPFAYNEWVTPPLRMHAIERYLLLAGQLGPMHMPLSLPLPQTPLYPKKMAAWGHGVPIVVLVPGARWPSKIWPAYHFAMLADMLIARMQAKVVLVGASSDCDIGRQILEHCQAASQVVNWIGQTSLADLTAIMVHAHLVVTNDSGPMHIATAVGTPTVALFGPTDPARTGPYGSQHVVLQARLPCEPCLQKICRRPDFCLKAITPQQVWQTVESCLRLKSREFAETIY